MPVPGSRSLFMCLQIFLNLKSETHPSTCQCNRFSFYYDESLISQWLPVPYGRLPLPFWLLSTATPIRLPSFADPETSLPASASRSLYLILARFGKCFIQNLLFLLAGLLVEMSLSLRTPLHYTFSPLFICLFPQLSSSVNMLHLNLISCLRSPLFR